MYNTWVLKLHRDRGRSGGEAMVVDVKETRPSAVAATLKKSDQLAGQTFNDVGPLNEEETVRVERREKM